MDIKHLADIYRALGDPTRLKIISLLRIRDCCICELVPIFGISQPAVSRHMSRLKSVQLVRESRRGQWVFYSLNRETFQKARIDPDILPDCSHDLNLLKEKGLMVCMEEET
jgi:ArsR family transcriptional regulator